MHLLLLLLFLYFRWDFVEFLLKLNMVLLYNNTLYAGPRKLSFAASFYYYYRLIIIINEPMVVMICTYHIWVNPFFVDVFFKVWGCRGCRGFGFRR